jgi:hypothetical protein
MSWVTYTLLGVVIIVLIICIVYLSRPYIREGLLDYFDIEDYLTAVGTQNTVGRYVRIYPSDLGLDLTDTMSFSQIQVFDMNGTNIALGKTVYASSKQTGSADVSTTIDGTVTLRGGANVWKSLPGIQEYWQLDLGRLYQISRVSVIGTSESNLTLKGMKVFIVDKPASIVTEKDKCKSSTCQFMAFKTSDSKQTITFQNNINLTPAPVDLSTVSPLNVDILPMRNTQPEVFLVGPTVPGSSAEAVCTNIGARLATKGQLEYAAIKGALWSEYGWLGNSSNVLEKPYRIVKGSVIIQDKTTKNAVEVSPTVLSRAMVNCFGIKPDSGNSEISTPFNDTPLWSEYTNANRAMQSFGTEETVPVPDIEVIKSNLILLTDPNYANRLGIGSSAYTDACKTYTSENTTSSNKRPICKDAPQSWSLVDGSHTSSLKDLTAASVVPQKTKAFYSMLLKHAAYTFASDINYSTAPKSIYDITSGNTGVTVFGTIDPQARADMAQSLEYCRKIFVGSPSDVDRFINVQYIDSTTRGINSSYKATIRNSNGYDKYCRPELDLSGFNPSRYGYNLSNCSTELTPAVLALIPDPTRNFIIEWIYNRTQLFIEKKQYYFENPPPAREAQLATATDSQKSIAATMEQIYSSLGRTVSLDSLVKGIKPSPPTAAQITAAKAITNTQVAAIKKLKADIKIDVTNETVLNSIAQSFYEALGGNYIMTNIYDIYTIGNTILDIRFDLTKHGDIGPFQDKISELNLQYNSIRNSNLAQDVLEKAKSDYENAIDDLQDKETNNTYAPVLGVVGRFFYRYDTSSASFTITGFTLNAKAATSFIPELNGGTQVSIGSDVGNLNFEPTIKYTLNIPELLDCTNVITLRRIMSDYVGATTTDLATVLYNATPSMDVEKGRVYVSKIVGAVQIAPTQCAITWEESLWDDGKNAPVSNLKDVKRSALISYSVNQDDWYSSQITFDPSGFAFFSSDKVPSCTFDIQDYKAKVAPRLDSASDEEVQKDFIQVGFNKGYTPICPNALPKYIFNPSDYVEAHGDLQVFSDFKDQTSGIVNTTGALNHYTSTGFNKSGIYEKRVIRKSQNITTLNNSIIIDNPFPGGTSLDNANSVCPTTSCEDFDTLYSIVEQYNNDPTSPGSILRVTKSYTPNQYKCDIQADIDYNVKVPMVNENDTSAPAPMVYKGSFSYDSDGAPKKNDDEIPSGLKKGTTLGLGISVDINTCNIEYNSIVDEGYSIRSTTPTLPKPLEYATEFQKRKNASMTTSFNKIATSAESALSSVKTTLPTYKANTLNAQEAIATLGTNCTSKCDSTENVNNMLQFYKAQNKKAKVIDSVLRVKTLDSSTCEMTFTEQTPILSEVFGVKGPLTQTQARAKCASYGGTLATYDQVVKSQAAGGGWCSWGWIADDASRKDQKSFPVQTTDECYNDAPGTKVRIEDGGSETHGANCYAVKPAITDELLPFSKNNWAQPPHYNTQTTAAQFKMGSTGNCTFNVTSMLPILPSIPDTMPFAAPNWWSTPPIYTDKSYNISEVFGVKGPLTQTQAQVKCASYGGTLATYDQVVEAQAAGGGWCSWGWIADDASRKDQKSFPVQTTDECYNDAPGTKVRLEDGGSETHGANCYAVKPAITDELLPFSSTKWSQLKTSSSTTFPYSNPYKETFTNYKTIQVTESTFPLNKSSFGIDIARNKGGPGLDMLFVEPLRQESKPLDSVGPKYVDADENLKGENASSYKYIRFRPTKTRDPSSPVNVAKIRFFLKKNEVDLRAAKVTNPMGTWVGDITDVNGPGYTRGWSDKHKRALVFAFPYALMMDGFSWTTADPDKGIGGDPVQWKLEGSTNGTYWTTLRDQSQNYAVPVDRFQDLPVFQF